MDGQNAGQNCDKPWLPLKLQIDNDPELISLILAQGAEEHGVILEFIKISKPTQNAFIERGNWTYRTENTRFYLLRTLNNVREISSLIFAKLNIIFNRNQLSRNSFIS